jgi:hypothetical protein
MKYVPLLSYFLLLHSYGGGMATVPGLSKEECDHLQAQYATPSIAGFSFVEIDGAPYICPNSGGTCTKQPSNPGNVASAECVEVK